MGGGLLQLVAYGAQDVYLTGNPQITFFKTIYKRHTNFSIESVQQIFDGVCNFGRQLTCTISRKGDLLSQMFLTFDLPAMPKGAGGQDISWCNSIGHYLIESYELEIGGQLIDKQYGEWLEIWSELTLPASKLDGYNNMVGKYDQVAFENDTQMSSLKLHVPLQFWFCRNVGLALPLVALQYHEVKMLIKLRDFNKLYYSGDLAVTPVTTPDITSGYLYCDYIYLDTEERRRFAQNSHEYLIEQVQFSGTTSIGLNETELNVPLVLNHPVKEISWIIQSDKSYKYNTHGNYCYEGASAAQLLQHDTGLGTNEPTLQDPLVESKLQLNGIDRYSARDGKYFRLVVPYQRHTRIPQSFVYTYAFALKPEEHQPSGTCNFSRIDNAILNVQVKSSSTYSSRFRLYALNYNILRIMSGMGGVAYSN